jgi:mannose-6-phosphate isomerase-like protein (cupin superfamily)
MKLTQLLFLAAALLPLQAADPTGAIFWTAADMKAKDKVLATKLDETKSAMDKIITMSNFNALNFHREGSGQSEVHEKFADFVIVRSGGGAILVGGTSKNAKPTTPGETRGDGVEGGTRYKLTPGDVLYIPAGVPHQMIVEKGKELNAMVIKVEAAK